MNICILLAGGIGSRMGTDIPKQYLLVEEKPIISYTLKVFENHKEVDKIVIVIDEAWKDYVDEWLKKENISKFVAYAKPGTSRQGSIYNGLKAASEFANDDDVVIVQDAARPLTSNKIISDCIEGATSMDGAMPVITVKDTIYQSKDGKSIHSLLNRSELFAGQAPESFKFKKYYDIHNSSSKDEIEKTVGSSEIAYRHGMKIKLIDGSEGNFKITTIEDLDTFKYIIANK